MTSNKNTNGRSGRVVFFNPPSNYLNHEYIDPGVANTKTNLRNLMPAMDENTPVGEISPYAGEVQETATTEEKENACSDDDISVFSEDELSEELETHKESSVQVQADHYQTSFTHETMRELTSENSSLNIVEGTSQADLLRDAMQAASPRWDFSQKKGKLIQGWRKSTSKMRECSTNIDQRIFQLDKEITQKTNETKQQIREKTNEAKQQMMEGKESFIQSWRKSTSNFSQRFTSHNNAKDADDRSSLTVQTANLSGSEDSSFSTQGTPTPRSPTSFFTSSHKKKRESEDLLNILRNVKAGNTNFKGTLLDMLENDDEPRKPAFNKWNKWFSRESPSSVIFASKFD
jgi:hypothetical protein